MSEVGLFDRTTLHVQLTDAGREFHNRAVELLAWLDEAEEAATSASGELKGRIRVAGPVSFTTHCLAPAVGQWEVVPVASPGHFVLHYFFKRPAGT